MVVALARRLADDARLLEQVPSRGEEREKRKRGGRAVSRLPPATARLPVSPSLREEEEEEGGGEEEEEEEEEEAAPHVSQRLPTSRVSPVEVELQLRELAEARRVVVAHGLGVPKLSSSGLHSTTLRIVGLSAALTPPMLARCAIRILTVSVGPRRSPLTRIDWSEPAAPASPRYDAATA